MAFACLSCYDRAVDGDIPHNAQSVRAAGGVSIVARDRVFGAEIDSCAFSQDQIAFGIESEARIPVSAAAGIEGARAAYGHDACAVIADPAGIHTASATVKVADFASRYRQDRSFSKIYGHVEIIGIGHFFSYDDQSGSIA